MGSGETERKMAERHVALGRKDIARQLEIIRELRCQGYPTDGAERLLASLEDRQRLHEANLERLPSSS